MKHAPLFLWVLVPSVSVALWACAEGPQLTKAKEPPASKEVQAPPTKEVPEDKDGMEVQGGLGQVDPLDVREAWKEQMPEVQRCSAAARTRLWYLSGKVDVRVRLGQDGGAKAAYVVDSSLGNYEIERCVRAAALRLRLAPPKGGGEAEFTYPVEFPGRAAVASWPTARVASDILRHKGEIEKCTPPQSALTSSMRLTLYIGPGGKVGSVGLAAEEPIDERLGTCLIGKAQTWRFEDPLGQLVKVRYAFAESP